LFGADFGNLDVMATSRIGFPQGLALFVAGQAVSAALDRVTKALKPDAALEKDRTRAYYRELKRPVFAPPGWAFGPAWLLNSALLSAAFVRAYNARGVDPEKRSAYLAAQGLHWLLYVAFAPLDFGLRSPLNGALITLLDTVTIGVATRLSLDFDDDVLTALHLTTVAWLGIAAPLSLAIAAWNRDDYWQAGPFAAADPRWVKNEPAPSGGPDAG
jgi:tryptophan-rich sensory protein